MRKFYVRDKIRIVGLNIKVLITRFLVRPKSKLVKVISDTTRRVPYNRLTFYPNREVRNRESLIH